MKNLKKLFIFIILLIYSNEKEENTKTNIIDNYKFLYTIRAGPNEEDMPFLVDLTKQDTYFFQDSELNSKNDEIETTIELNNIFMKNFQYKLTNSIALNKNKNDNEDKITGILGLGTAHGKNMFVDQLRNNNLIKSRKIYISLLDDEPKIQFQYELPKHYGEKFYFCPLLLYKDSFPKKYYEGWICEMTHILVKNEENPADINKKIYLNNTYETIGKIIFNPNSKFITAPEIYLHYLKIQYSMNSRNRCSAYKRGDKIYLFCKYENEKNFEKLPYFGVLIEGYLHKIPVKYLFVKTEYKNKYMSLIRFDKKNNKGHLWEFGLPIFKSFTMQLDFENRRIGFGEPLLKSEDLTNEWIQWYSLHEGLSPRLFANKLTMIIGLAIFSIILLVIIIWGTIGYFINYNKSKGQMSEEISQNIELSQK